MMKSIFSLCVMPCFIAHDPIHKTLPDKLNCSKVSSVETEGSCYTSLHALCSEEFGLQPDTSFIWSVDSIQMVTFLPLRVVMDGWGEKGGSNVKKVVRSSRYMTFRIIFLLVAASNWFSNRPNIQSIRQQLQPIRVWDTEKHGMVTEAELWKRKTT